MDFVKGYAVKKGLDRAGVAEGDAGHVSGGELGSCHRELQPTAQFMGAEVGSSFRAGLSDCGKEGIVLGEVRVLCGSSSEVRLKVGGDGGGQGDGFPCLFAFALEIELPAGPIEVRDCGLTEFGFSGPGGEHQLADEGVAVVNQLRSIEGGEEAVGLLTCQESPCMGIGALWAGHGVKGIVGEEMLSNEMGAPLFDAGEAQAIGPCRKSVADLPFVNEPALIGVGQGLGERRGGVVLGPPVEK